MVPDKQKHILLVVRHPVGGIRTYIKYIYNKPDFKDCRFTIILPKNNLLDMFMDAVHNIEVKHIICDSNARSMVYAIYRALKRKDVDLIHSHGYTSGIYSSLPARYFNIPHIMTVHDILLNKQFSGLKGLMKKIFIPYFVNLINIINTVSDDVGKNIQDMLPRIKKDRIITILNGIDIEIFNNGTKRDFRKELDIPNHHIIIGFVGRFMSPKGFIYLIEALEILYKQDMLSIEITVIAIGSEGFIREDKELIRLKGLNDRFIFLPPVDDISEFLKGFDIIVIPSLWEACPLVPMEALVAGVPVIASNCIGLREVIRGSPAFVAEPANAVSLAGAIKQCLNDAREEEFAAYVPIAKQRFDSSHTAKRLAALYEDLIAK